MDLQVTSAFCLGPLHDEQSMRNNICRELVSTFCQWTMAWFQVLLASISKNQLLYPTALNNQIIQLMLGGWEVIRWHGSLVIIHRA